MQQTYVQQALFPEYVTEDFSVEEELVKEELVEENVPVYQTTRRVWQLLQHLMQASLTRQKILAAMKDFYDLSDDDLATRNRAQENADRKFRDDIRFLESLGYQFKTTGRGMDTRYTFVAESVPGSIFSLSQPTLATLALLYTSFVDATQPQSSATPAPITSNNPFAQDIVELVQSISSKLPEDQRDYFRRLTQKPHVCLQLDLARDYTQCRDTIDAIVRALEHKRLLDFDYTPGSGGKKITRNKNIDPQHIEQRDGQLYLIGYNYDRGQYFEYRLDRILNISSFSRPNRSTQLRKTYTFSYWADETLVKDGISHRWLTERPIKHEFYADPQGRQRQRTLIEATNYSDWRIIPQLLKYGDKVELVGPSELRQKMMQEIQRIYSIYHLSSAPSNQDRS